MFLTSRNYHFWLLLGDFLTSDDMQDGESDRLRFPLKYEEMVKIGSKNFLAHFGFFFRLCPPAPYELRLKILSHERPYYLWKVSSV